MIEECKCDMMRKYEMTDLGLLHHFLGICVIQQEGSIFIHQKKYALSLINKFGLKNCKSIIIPLPLTDKLIKDDGSEAIDEELYKRIVGSLLYLTGTRHDIMYLACVLARYMHCPSTKQRGTTKRILRYVQGTVDYGIKYEKGNATLLIGFYDNEWSGDEDDMKSISGYAFSFNNGAFSWASIKQQSVALSTA
ncbi:secreted RxLR effector protein 161-like [Malus sylvestris]|uniref:secreted RxLR effector protein 161-like n=1 Tax=Malus sylvestris TaxID=3752 RepID=UPI0021ABBB0D|nr:secreted RxLR effector protein 161-like [Malus sylvestris]